MAFHPAHSLVLGLVLLGQPSPARPLQEAPETSPTPWLTRLPEDRSPQGRLTVLWALNALGSDQALRALEGLTPAEARQWPTRLPLEPAVATARLQGCRLTPEVQAFLEARNAAGVADPAFAQAAQLRLRSAGLVGELLPPIPFSLRNARILLEAWNQVPWSQRAAQHEALRHLAESGAAGERARSLLGLAPGRGPAEPGFRSTLAALWAEGLPPEHPDRPLPPGPSAAQAIAAAYPVARPGVVRIRVTFEGPRVAVFRLTSGTADPALPPLVEAIRLGGFDGRGVAHQGTQVGLGAAPAFLPGRPTDRGTPRWLEPGQVVLRQAREGRPASLFITTQGGPCFEEDCRPVGVLEWPGHTLPLLESLKAGARIQRMEVLGSKG